MIDTIFDEIKSRVQETDLSAPVLHHGWWYVTSTEEGQSYPIHRRGRSAESAADSLVLDQNVEAAGHEFFELGGLEPNPAHTLAAWSADIAGNEHYTLRIRDIEAGTDLDDEIADTVAWAGTAWSADGRTCSTSEPTRRSGRSRCGATGSARRSPTTRACTTRPMSGSM